MDTIITNHIEKLEYGEVQSFNNMDVVPLFTSLNHGPQYVTLSEAIEQGKIAVTEVSEGGSVPTLKVMNDADVGVLLLDGEEVAGAKQNRILNTTILLDARTKLDIPVSCVEQGRWSYASRDFKSSGHVAHPNLRSAKNRSVSDSLRRRQSYASNQGEVWDKVADLCAASGTHSPTHAMRDTFEQRQGDIERYREAFRLLPSQKGLLVLIAGKVVGMDMVSLESAYAQLHAKLIGSYAMEAVLGNGRAEYADVPRKARDFMEKAAQSAEEIHKSTGLGNDHRFQTRKLVGSSLVCDGKVIHMAFFRVEENEKPENMSSLKRRRGFRQ
jgi:hypothetical protein